MEVRLVEANDLVSEDKGKRALEYGPLEYAVEQVDNPDLDSLMVGPGDAFSVSWEDGILGGVNFLKTFTISAVPYFAWSNRGVGKMKIWIDAR